jgi:hypothetical protein
MRLFLLTLLIYVFISIYLFVNYRKSFIFVCVVCPNCLCSFVCCVLFERGLLFCVACVFLCVVSQCSTTATSKTPFAVELNNIFMGERRVAVLHAAVHCHK